MKRDLRWIVIHLTVALLLLYLAGGCSTTQPRLQPVSGVCRHHAVYCALTYWDLAGIPTVIGVGDTDKGQRHAQAFAVVDGEYKPLQRWADKVFVGRAELARAEQYYTIQQYIIRMHAWRAMHTSQAKE